MCRGSIGSRSRRRNGRWCSCDCWGFAAAVVVVEEWLEGVGAELLPGHTAGSVQLTRGDTSSIGRDLVYGRVLAVCSTERNDLLASLNWRRRKKVCVLLRRRDDEEDLV